MHSDINNSMERERKHKCFQVYLEWRKTLDGSIQNNFFGCYGYLPILPLEHKLRVLRRLFLFV